MSSIVVHVGPPGPASEVEAVYIRPAHVARWTAPPQVLVAAGQIPAWANAVIVDLDGTALPVQETPEEVAALLAHAEERMWYAFRLEGDEIWGSYWNHDTCSTVSQGKK